MGSAECTACPADSSAPEKSVVNTACQCSTGTTGPDGGECQACEAGKYKDAVGSAECTACPADSSAPEKSVVNTACQCSTGTTGGDGQACSACEAGKYKDAVGSGTCTDCPASTSSEVKAAICLCNHGTTGPDGGACSACPAGKYKIILGSEDCKLCEAGKFKSEEGWGMCTGISYSIILLSPSSSFVYQLKPRTFSCPFVMILSQIRYTSTHFNK